jgi:hypothetical protein
MTIQVDFSQETIRMLEVSNANVGIRLNSISVAISRRWSSRDDFATVAIWCWREGVALRGSHAEPIIERAWLSQKQ